MSRTNYLLPLESLQPILSIPATKIQPDELFLTDSSIKAANTPAAFNVMTNRTEIHNFSAMEATNSLPEIGFPLKTGPFKSIFESSLCFDSCIAHEPPI